MTPVEELKQEVQRLGLDITKSSFDKLLMVYLLLKNNPKLQNSEIREALTLVDGRGISNSEIADVRELLGISSKRAQEKSPAQASTTPAAAVAAPVSVGSDGLRFGDKAEAFQGEVFGARGTVTKFGKSNRDGAPGVQLRLEKTGELLWTDLANVRRVK